MSASQRLRIPRLDTKPIPITGYLDRFSGRPGETLKAYVSVADRSHYAARLVRVIGGDPNPAGPGMAFEDLSALFQRHEPGHAQPLQTGSFAEVAAAPRLPGDAPVTWSALIWFGLRPRRGAVIGQCAGENAIALYVTEQGLRAEARAGDRRIDLDLPSELALDRWTRVWISLDPLAGKLVVGCQPVGAASRSVSATVEGGWALPDGGRLTIAAAGEPATDHFTGKIEAPGVYAGFIETWNHPLRADLQPIAEWDFSRSIASQSIEGSGPDAAPGVLHNLPTRAVTGAHWTGEEHSWRHAPAHYAAIHFHEDDFGSCQWTESFTLTIPEELQSGAYALHLLADTGAQDWLPFYVLPPRAGPRARVVFLAPTYTYQAYANCYFANRLETTQARGAVWGASVYTGAQYGSYGRSTYNWHADGSGVSLSSRHRPMLTMRPGFIFEDDPKGSGVRHYPADTHLLGWLESKGVPFDVVTDEDLDDEGFDLISGYSCVLTGTHPEYHTAGTLDALQAYVDAGGHLAYLGANGFYWRIARNADLPEVIEVRRAEGGIRTWAAEPGEYYHQLDGQLGGIWRRNGRHPQRLAGVGFTAQGPFDAGHYRVTDGARRGPAAWILEGVETDVLGNYGLCAGGAAGFELDRAEPQYGAPGEVHLVATSEGLPETFGVVHEEMLTEALTISGAAVESLVRADMVLVETAAGGSVFSVGSITFCGSLWNGEGFDGPISRILENVVRRFSASTAPSPL